MKNVILIQHESVLNNPYIILDNEHIYQIDKNVNAIIDKTVFCKEPGIVLRKAKSVGIEISRKFWKGYLIEGMLIEKDEGGRRMSFTCFYAGDLLGIRNYLELNFKKINKNIEVSHLKIIEDTLKKYKVFKTLILFLLTLGILYMIIK